MTDAHGTPESHDEKDHAPDAHAGDGAGGHDAGHDDHHAVGALGPVDWRMWLVGAIGIVAALVVVVAFVISTDFAFLAAGA